MKKTILFAMLAMASTNSQAKNVDEGATKKEHPPSHVVVVTKEPWSTVLSEFKPATPGMRHRVDTVVGLEGTIKSIAGEGGQYSCQHVLRFTFGLTEAHYQDMLDLGLVNVVPE